MLNVRLGPGEESMAFELTERPHRGAFGDAAADESAELGCGVVHRAFRCAAAGELLVRGKPDAKGKKANLARLPCGAHVCKLAHRDEHVATSHRCLHSLPADTRAA